MWYMGGKFRQSKQITEVLKNFHGTGFNYCEPFCGGMGSASEVIEKLKPNMVALSDTNRPLVLLWGRLIEGTIDLPSTVTDEEYQSRKQNQDMDDPLTAYFGFALSFGGKWFGGLGRKEKGRKKEYDVSWAIRSINLKVNKINSAQNLYVGCQDYQKTVEALPGEGWVIYLDPPYENRTKAHFFGTFDYKDFWGFTRKISQKHYIYISCFSYPEDFGVVYDWGNTVNSHRGQKTDNTSNVREVLVKYKGGRL